MKPRLRILLRLAGVLVVLFVVALVSGLEGVDHRPYFHAPYYTETVARLRAQTATNELIRGELQAGFGRALLTPTLNAPQVDAARGQFPALPLAGYGHRHGRAATGVLDDLYVKAVALRVGDRLGVMVGADALIIPRPVGDAVALRLEKELGLRREQIYLSATHTHCSLGGWGEGMVSESFAGKFEPGVRIWFADRIVAAVREAVADLKPAEFGHGSFSAPEYVKNRLVGKLGQVDPEFSYAVLKQNGGRLGVMGSYSAHATVLPSKVMEISADYPGCWQQAIEQATGGVAVFLAGGVGSHAPASVKQDVKGVEQMGRALAQMLLAKLPQTPLTNVIAFDLLGLEVSLPELNVRATDGIRLRPWVARRFLPVAERSYLQGFRLDDAVWISTPCDFSGELALGIKDLLRVRGFHGVITSFNGDYIGYVVPARYYHVRAYESRNMSFYGPTVPDYFDELIRTLALDLAGR